MLFGTLSFPHSEFRHSTLGKLHTYNFLSRSLVDQLIAYSTDETDEELREGTSDARRFANHKKYREWSRKSRSPYVIVDEAGTLLVFVWLGEDGPPACVSVNRESIWHTFAIRAYGKARGARLTKPLAQAAIMHHRALHPGNIWLEVNADNEPALHLYTGLGFKEIGRTEKGRLVMTLES